MNPRKMVISFGLAVSFLTPSANAEQELKTQVIHRSEVPHLKVLNGQIEAVNKSTVSAQTSGSIEALNYDVGDFVEKDSVIAQIKSRNQQAGLERARASVEQARASAARANASYKSAQARAEEASSEYKRVKLIFDRQLISRAEFDRAAAAMKSANAEVGAAKAAWEAAVSAVKAAEAQRTQAGEQLGYTAILAPYSGIVTDRHVQLGEVVAAGKPVMTGISLEKLRVTTEVPQSMMNDVRRYREATVQLPDGRTSEVLALNIFPYADTLTNAFKVRAKLEEGIEGVFPGSFVKIAFVVGKKAELTLPESMVVYRGEVTGVYVINGDGLPALRQVRLGKRLDNGHVVILAGLDDGETIATDPVHATLYLKRHAQVQAQEKAND